MPQTFIKIKYIIFVRHKKKPTVVGFLVNWHPVGDSEIRISLAYSNPNLRFAGTATSIIFGSDSFKLFI